MVVPNASDQLGNVRVESIVDEREIRILEIIQ